MPTQAYSVTQELEIGGADLTDYINEIRITENDGEVDDIRARLETARRAHNLTEGMKVYAKVSDGENTKEFWGRVDRVKDDESRPVVTVEAREPKAQMQDAIAVGNNVARNPFDVIDKLVNEGLSQVRNISFNPDPLKDEYRYIGEPTQFAEWYYSPTVDIDRFLDFDSLEEGDERVAFDFSDGFYQNEAAIKEFSQDYEDGGSDFSTDNITVYIGGNANDVISNTSDLTVEFDLTNELDVGASVQLIVYINGYNVAEISDTISGNTTVTKSVTANSDEFIAQEPEATLRIADVDGLLDPIEITEVIGEKTLEVDNQEEVTLPKDAAIELEGVDADGEDITVSLEHTGGDSVEDAYGTDLVLPSNIEGGNERVADITGLTDAAKNAVGEITSNFGDDALRFQFTLVQFIDLRYKYAAADKTSVAEAVDDVVSQISSIDGRTWEWYIDPETEELIVEPEATEVPPTRVVKEGDNVIRPIADRNLDGVHNYVHVSGGKGVNAWAYAYDGNLWVTNQNPQKKGLGSPFHETFDTTDGRSDIDEIDLRTGDEATVNNPRIVSEKQARQVAKRILRSRYRASVSGSAPITGIDRVSAGDKIEVYYPSRGIPQKVEDNVYTVDSVEYRVRPQEAQTTADFSIRRPDAETVVSRLIRDEVSEFNPVVGEVLQTYPDGTARIETEDGRILDRVRVI